MSRRRRKRKHDSRERETLFKAELVRSFVEVNGWSAFTRDTIVAGVRVGLFVQGCRSRYKRDQLGDFAADALEAIPGWTWHPREDRLKHNVDSLRTLVRTRGWSAVGVEGGPEGVRLGIWCSKIRCSHESGELQPWIRRAVEAIPGWSWEPRDDRYDTWLRAIRAFVASHGWPALYDQQAHDQIGSPVGNWVKILRQQYRENTLPDWVLIEAESVPGWEWDPRSELQWRKLDVFRRFIAVHGWEAFRVSRRIDGLPIRTWVHSCLARQRRGELPEWLRNELEAVPGWRWRTG